ncbi:helix-turn-helix transcriptional regulator [Acinetobacter sp.]|uniref:helix-turn-helix domain-containing protein n=1 Tax=Acinetobacter sp. TaxID=472 RepID=UPI0031D86708
MNTVSDETYVFPERLKLVRELRKLTQAQLAEKSKIPSTSISHLEAGARKPSFDNLRKLGIALDVSTDYLLGRSENLEGTNTDTLFRDLQNLTESDRETIRRFAESLRNK